MMINTFVNNFKFLKLKKKISRKTTKGFCFFVKRVNMMRMRSIIVGVLLSLSLHMSDRKRFIYFYFFSVLFTTLERCFIRFCFSDYYFSFTFHMIRVCLFIHPNSGYIMCAKFYF